MPWGGVKGWAAEKAAPCAVAAFSWKGRKRYVDFFFFNSFSHHTQDACYQSNDWERWKEERAGNKLLPAPSPQKWGSPHFQLLCSCAALCIFVEGAALVMATESQRPGPRGRVSNYGYHSCFESLHITKPLSSELLSVNKWQQREVVAEVEEYSRIVFHPWI